MANSIGKLPLFASAPRARIRFNGNDIAFAVGLNLDIGVNLQEVRILGEFAIQTIEPLNMIPVTGSMQVVRLISAATQAAQKAAAATVEGELTTQSILDQNQDVPGVQGQITESNSIPNNVTGAGAFNGQTLLARHLDPRTILMSQSFDIEILLKVPAIEIDAAGLAQPLAPNTINNPDLLSAFLTIKDVRLSGASSNLSPAQLLTESVEFQGTLAIMEGRASKIRESQDLGFRDNISQ